MIDISVWLHTFLNALAESFTDRIWFVGLQGSYGRGEATANSDVDVVVILDKVSACDIQRYSAMLDSLPYREKICGFFSGRDELLNWERSDLFQFYHDTMPIKGSLDELLPLIDNAAVDRSIKTGVCNIYHGCVHNMLHKKSEKVLIGLYKSASFVVQAIAFQQTGTYIRSQKELSRVVLPDEKKIVDCFLHLKSGGDVDFVKMSDLLFTWSKGWIDKL